MVVDFSFEGGHIKMKGHGDLPHFLTLEIEPLSMLGWHPKIVIDDMKVQDNKVIIRLRGYEEDK